MTGKAPGPFVVIRGITINHDSLVKTIAGPISAAPSSAALRDHVTALVRPAALCFNPRRVESRGGPRRAAPVLPRAPTRRRGRAPSSTRTRSPSSRSSGRSRRGCLPQGRYAITLVYPGGQAWTVPNEAGGCAALEGATTTGERPTCSIKPGASSSPQGARGVLEIIGPSQEGLDSGVYSRPCAPRVSAALKSVVVIGNLDGVHRGRRPSSASARARRRARRVRRSARRRPHLECPSGRGPPRQGQAAPRHDRAPDRALPRERRRRGGRRAVHPRARGADAGALRGGAPLRATPTRRRWWWARTSASEPGARVISGPCASSARRWASRSSRPRSRGNSAVRSRARASATRWRRATSGRPRTCSAGRTRSRASSSMATSAAAPSAFRPQTWGPSPR